MAAPDQAPPGVTLRFLPRPNTTLAGWQTWAGLHPTGTYWENRPLIRPRLILIHTNAASIEATAAAIYNVAMSAQDTAKPTYQVDRNGAAVKFLPSNRQGVCNYQADPFSVSIETADLGYGHERPGDVHFTPEQGEMVARIVAFEADLWRIPIATPVAWDGSGVAAHTDPFGYPYWTKYQGKTCPGALKKIDVRDWILPRAIELMPPPEPPDPLPVPLPPEIDMSKPCFVRQRGYTNVIHITDAGAAIAVSGEMLTHFDSGGPFPKIFQDHPWSWSALCRLARVEPADLVPGGPSDRF